MHSRFKEIIDICNKYDKKINITTNGTLLSKRLNDLIGVRQINISLQSIVDINILDDIINTCNILSEKTFISYRFWVRNKYEEIIKNKIKLGKNIFISEDKEFIWPSLDNPVLRNKGTCLGTKDHIGILVDGTVIPCCLDSKGIINLGNIFNNNLEDILNSEKFKTINQGFKENRIVEELCTKCGFKKENEHE